MGLTVYKSGQGKWTRLGSAVGFGLLVIFGAGWAWNELAGIGSPEAVVNRNVIELVSRLSNWGRERQNEIKDLKSITSIKLDGTVVKITGNTPSHEFVLPGSLFEEAANKIVAKPGTTLIENVSTDDANKVTMLRLKTIELPEKSDKVIFRSAGSFTFYNRMYIQAAVSIGIILGFGLLLWWLLNHPKIVEFMIATEAEMRKVNWPSKREITGATWVVIVCTLAMAFLIFLADLGFAFFFKHLGILAG